VNDGSSLIQFNPIQIMSAPVYEVDRPAHYRVVSSSNLVHVLPCIMFELDTTYRSRDITVTIFHWTPA